MQIYFYKGLKEKYNLKTHGDGIYFALDTQEILHKGLSFNEKVNDLTYNAKTNQIRLTSNWGDDWVITIDSASGVRIQNEDGTYSVQGFNGLMSKEDKAKLDILGDEVIVNNLESDKTNVALSAAQGKRLLNRINEVIASVYDFKGSVERFSDLPTSGQKKGDVYNVNEAVRILPGVGEEPTKVYPAGTNWAWVGDNIESDPFKGWDPLGGDMASLYTQIAKNMINPDSNIGLNENNQLTLYWF